MEARSFPSAAPGGSVGRAALRSVPAAREVDAAPRSARPSARRSSSSISAERLLDATAEAIADAGYCDLTVRDLIDRAGVSRRTFYQLFDDKLECVLAAHEAAFGKLEKVLEKACAAHSEWPDGVAAAVAAGLELRRPLAGRGRAWS